MSTISPPPTMVMIKVLLMALTMANRIFSLVSSSRLATNDDVVPVIAFTIVACGWSGNAHEMPGS